MSANENIEDCLPISCCIFDCVKEMLKSKVSKYNPCGKGESIGFELGTSSTTKRKKKLGSCSVIETRSIDLIFIVTMKACAEGQHCKTLKIQKWIDERFAENPCFCHISSGPAILIDSDIVHRSKDSGTVVRQIIYEVPFMVTTTVPQASVKRCKHSLDDE